MKNWQDYKNTYRTESDLFDFARSGDLRGFADLLSKNIPVDLNAVNQKGYSPLMLAVYNSQHDFCEALLRCGADIHGRDFIGNTVLMASAFKGNLALLKLLLQYGAITSHINTTKMNARDWAKMFGRTEVVQYLDTHYPDQANSSKLKSIIRFIKLGFIMTLSKLKK